MTRERKLAIKMWEEVKKHLPQWYKENQRLIAPDLQDFKADFCVVNDLHWVLNCWFCQYIFLGCDKCPLKSCNFNEPTNAWARIVNENTSLETKLQACDEIIVALKGEHK